MIILTLHAYGRSPEEAIADVMRWMYRRGLVQVRGGNASIVDRKSRRVYISPTGVPRDLMDPSNIAILELDSGRVLRGEPSGEWRMHLEVYKKRDYEVAAVHAHPKHLLLVDRLGYELDLSLLTEARIYTRCITRVPPLPPVSPELAREVGRVLGETECNVIILVGHGVLVTSDKSIYHALDLLEAIEDTAYMTLKAVEHRKGPS